MSIRYFPVIATPFGVALEQPTDFISAEYNWVENEVGTAKLTLPRARYPKSLFARDYILQFWVSIDGAPPILDMEKDWLIRGVKRNANGKQRTWTISAFCINHLWKRRIVDYNEDNAYTSKLDYLDDMGKEVFYENYGAGATDATRDISAYVSIQQDLSLAAISRQSFARDSVYDVLRKFSATSWEYGTYLVFDTVKAQDTQPRWQFRSYTGQRGIDRRSVAQLIFGSDFNNLTNVEVDDDATDEVTRGIAGGQGVATTQAVARYTSPRASDSPFNLIERWENHTEEGDAQGLIDAATAIPNRYQPRATLSGDIVEKPGSRYRIDWREGDRVRGQDEADLFDCRISAVSVKVNRDGGDKVTAQLRGELTDG